ncbi:Cyclic nucleotide-binding domain protein [Candidatus Magnetomorum sp. HK-1]|nr:Cyclic nucleotide-binding domain protein [Candidatus Magnetomorum sp. HK-1]
MSNADIFKDVDISELMQLAEHARIIYLPRKHLLIREGEVSDALYIIVHGVVDVFITDDSGNKKVINKIESGQLFGEIAALAGIPRIASVRISTPCVLCQISRTYILSFLHKNQQCVKKIWPGGLGIVFVINIIIAEFSISIHSLILQTILMMVLMARSFCRFR